MSYSLDVYMVYLFVQSSLIIAYVLGLTLFITKKGISNKNVLILMFSIALLVTILRPWIMSSVITVTVQHIHFISFITILIQTLPLFSLIYIIVKRESDA